MKLLILDSGHNEYVKGKEAPDKSLREWMFNNEMQCKIKKRAEEHGITVYLTNPSPEKKDEIGLTKRAELANTCWSKNNKPKSLFASIHANAYGSDFNDARGVETYVAKNASQNSKNAAKYIQEEIVKAMKSLDSSAKDRGVKTENFTVITKASMPSILLEYGFYSNKADLKILKENKDELVEATIKGICKYFDVEYKKTQSSIKTENVSNTSNNKLYAVCVSACAYDKAKTLQQELINKGYKDTYLIPR